MSFVFGGTAALVLVIIGVILRQTRSVRRLPALTELTPIPGEKSIRCSVVIAARDEANRLEQTLRHLLAQSGVSLEVIVVDDRSVDGTDAILRRIAAEDQRVRIGRVDELPPGWLGKCHACHQGAGMATGDWILFTDADCWLKPDIIARALRIAHREHADHITATAGTALESNLARAWYLLFLTTIVGWIDGVNRDRPKFHLGIGAFNLVRASAYRECGGYEALRLTVLDDIRLGLLLRRAGKRTRAFLGGDDVECHWGTKVRDMVKVMEKNYFAAIDFNLGIVAAGAAAVLAYAGVVALGLFAGTPPGVAAALSPLLFITPAAILERRMGWTGHAALFVPLMMPVMLYALLNSTFVTLRNGGIRWRDTFYPLDQLRAGTVK